MMMVSGIDEVEEILTKEYQKYKRTSSISSSPSLNEQTNENLKNKSSHSITKEDTNTSNKNRSLTEPTGKYFFNKKK